MIRNIGTIVSGDVRAPIVAGDTIVVREGVIASVGDAASADASGIASAIDAAGATVTPGLCDDHTHPVLGDFTPRQLQVDFIDSYLHGGTTTMISAGRAPHTRPSDRPRRRQGARDPGAQGVREPASVGRQGARGGRPVGARSDRGRLPGDGRGRRDARRRDRDLGREGCRGRRRDDALGTGVRDARDGAHRRARRSPAAASSARTSWCRCSRTSPGT